MKRERGIPFLFFVACLVAMVPFSWGGGALTAPDGAQPVKQSVGPPPHVPPNHLVEFEGDSPLPAPAPLLPVSPVPKTGQTGCYSQSSDSMNCAGSGQDGEYQAGVSVEPRFTDNSDGTVNDALTGLIWLKDPNCLGAHDWVTAISVASSLASGTCGLTDGSMAGAWRLPNVRELQSLIDYGHTLPALPPGHPFSGDLKATYWTSTTNTFSAYPPSLRPEFGSAWWVNFSVGESRAFTNSGESNKQFDAFVWPVRGGP
jgi:hypothetical protein